MNLFEAVISMLMTNSLSQPPSLDMLTSSRVCLNMGTAIFLVVTDMCGAIGCAAGNIPLSLYPMQAYLFLAHIVILRPVP